MNVTFRGVIEKNEKREVVNVEPFSVDRDEFFLYEEISSSELIDFVNRKQEEMGLQEKPIFIRRLELAEIRDYLQRRDKNTPGSDVRVYKLQGKYEVDLKIFSLSHKRHKEAILRALIEILLLEKNVSWYHNLMLYLFGVDFVVKGLFKKYSDWG